MNKYLCFYNNKEIEIEAKNTYEAQLKAQEHFQKKTKTKVQGYKIAIVLVQVDDREIIHSTTEF